jgi:DNA-binding NarL/FixJ family response regulator
MRTSARVPIVPKEPEMSVDNPTRVVLGDFSPVLREALAGLLLATRDFAIVARTETCDQTIDACLLESPHVVGLCLGMAGSPFEAARTIRARREGCGIVFLSVEAHAWYIRAAVEVGANGFVCASDTAEGFVAAFRAAARGGYYVSPEIAPRVSITDSGMSFISEAKDVLAPLTPREIEVLRFVAQGLSKKEIADSLHLSVKTVENHASSLMNRLSIHDRVGLTRLAIRERLVEP